MPSPFSHVAGQTMNIKMKWLFWSRDRGRTWLCLSHGSGGQRGPRGRRPGGTFRWSSDTLDPSKSWARWPRGIHGFQRAWPAVQTAIPPGAGLLTGWRSAPGQEAPGWEGCPLARSCNPAFAGGAFFSRSEKQTNKTLTRQIRGAPAISQILNGGWRHLRSDPCEWPSPESQRPQKEGFMFLFDVLFSNKVTLDSGMRGPFLGTGEYLQGLHVCAHQSYVPVTQQGESARETHGQPNAGSHMK